MNENKKYMSERVQSKRQIRNFLIDRKFQLGWVFRVAISVTLIVSVMGYFLYGTLVESIELTNAQILSTASMTEQAQREIVEKGAQDKVNARLILGGSLAGLVLLLSLLTIVVTHKIAGPVYKIKRLLARVDGGHLQLLEKLRKGDELHDVFKEFSDMLRRLRESRHLEVDQLESIIQSLETSGVSNSDLEELKLIVSRYKQSIHMHE